jgi:ribonuclease HIII
MGLQCNNIEALRVVLKNGCEEEKPNGQIKHQFENCVINTYDTGSVVIQDNSKDKSIEQQIKNLVQSINGLNINSCDKK